jgi:gamma-glutamylcyclotransferase (GGCT)/AIG2-like uncharacterized protein YtfP
MWSKRWIATTRAFGALHLFFYGTLMAGLGMADAGLVPTRAAHAALAGLDMAALDAYEGAEYRRQPVPVRTAAGMVDAQAYVWVAALPGDAKPILHGDFARYLRENGLRAFGHGR